jgi:hypothetical protein
MRDGVLLVLFNDSVIIPFENRDLTDPKDLLNILLQHQASGGTNSTLLFRLLILTIYEYHYLFI